MSKRSPIFYGWWLVLVCLLVMSIGTGTSLYLYSVVAGALQETYPSGRFMLMMGATLLFIAGGWMSPRIGLLADRYPLKWVLIIGAQVMGLGFLLISVSTSIWQVTLCYALFIAAGFATLSSLTASTLLSRWFTQHRGLAIGIAGLGTQFGGFVYPPAVAYLIELYDWRIALALLGIFIMVALPLLVYFTVRDYPDSGKPSLSGEDANGPDSANESGSGLSPAAKISLLALYTERNFLLLVLAVGGASIVNVAVIANLSIFATDMGESVERGAYLISLLSILGMISSPLVGRFCDIWNMKVVASAMFMLSVAAGIVFALADNYSLLLLACILQGLVGGCILPLWVSLVARIYHIRSYGQVMGASILVVYTLAALAPALAGWIHDITRSYHLFFLIMIGIMLAATVCAALLRLPAATATNAEGSAIPS